MCLVQNQATSCTTKQHDLLSLHSLLPENLTLNAIFQLFLLLVPPTFKMESVIQIWRHEEENLVFYQHTWVIIGNKMACIHLLLCRQFLQISLPIFIYEKVLFAYIQPTNCLNILRILINFLNHIFFLIPVTLGFVLPSIIHF